jgi:hypothetical protein
LPEGEKLVTETWEELYNKHMHLRDKLDLFRSEVNRLGLDYDTFPIADEVNRSQENMDLYYDNLQRAKDIVNEMKKL